MLDALDDANGVERRIANAGTHHSFDRCYFKVRSQAAGVSWKFRAASLVGTHTSALLEQSNGEHTHSGHASDHYGLRLVWEHPSAFGNLMSDVMVKTTMWLCKWQDFAGGVRCREVRGRG